MQPVTYSFRPQAVVPHSTIEIPRLGSPQSQHRRTVQEGEEELGQRGREKRKRTILSPRYDRVTHAEGSHMEGGGQSGVWGGGAWRNSWLPLSFVTPPPFLRTHLSSFLCHTPFLHPLLTLSLYRRLFFTLAAAWIVFREARKRYSFFFIRHIFVCFIGKQLFGCLLSVFILSS